MSASRRHRATAALEVAALALLSGVVCARPPTRVVVLGDSITAGISSQPRGPGYADLLRSQLGPEFEVVSLGCSGSTTRDWQPDAPPSTCRGPGEPIHLYASARALLPADVVTMNQQNDIDLLAQQGQYARMWLAAEGEPAAAAS